MTTVREQVTHDLLALYGPRAHDIVASFDRLAPGWEDEEGAGVWSDDEVRAGLVRVLDNGETEDRADAQRCGDWPAPCNCDDPSTHDRATEEGR